MSKPSKAILIDAKAQEVREVNLDGSLQNIYRELSNDEHKVDTFDVVRLENNDAIFVDDEGLLIEPAAPYYFVYGKSKWILAGNGLVIGTDDEGDSVDPKITVDEVRSRVTFFKYDPEREVLVSPAGDVANVPKPWMEFHPLN